MHKLKNGPIVVGTKQTIRALNKDKVDTIYIANDADKQIVLRAKELAESKTIPIVYISTMDELAKACNIKVETATAATIIK